MEGYKSPYEKYKEKMTIKKNIDKNIKRDNKKIYDHFVRNSIINSKKAKNEKKIIIPKIQKDYEIVYLNKKKTKSVKFDLNPVYSKNVEKEIKSGYESHNNLKKKKKGILKDYLKNDEYIYNPMRLRNSLYDYSTDKNNKNNNLEKKVEKKNYVFKTNLEKKQKSNTDYKLNYKNLNRNFRDKNYSDQKRILFADNYLKNNNFKINMKNNKNLFDHLPLKESNFERKTNFGSKSNFEIKKNFEKKSNFERKQNFEPKSNFQRKTNFELKSNFERKTNFEPKSNFERKSNFLLKNNFDNKNSYFSTKTNFNKKMDFLNIGGKKDFLYQKNSRFSEKDKNYSKPIFDFAKKYDLKKQNSFSNYESKNKNLYDTYKSLYKKKKNPNLVFNSEINILHKKKFSMNY